MIHMCLFEFLARTDGSFFTVTYIWPALVSNSLTSLEISCGTVGSYYGEVLEDWPVARILDSLTAPGLETLKLVIIWTVCVLSPRRALTETLSSHRIASLPYNVCPSSSLSGVSRTHSKIVSVPVPR
jgi:hypothetical protein